MAPIERSGPPRAGQQSESQHPARYEGPWFRAASLLPLDPGLARPDRLGALLVAAARRPRRFAAFIALLLRTTSERVPVSRSAAGEALRLYLNDRLFGVFPRNRLCRGVLLLPDAHLEYLRGHRRQALRTNLRRATDAGIWCESVADPSLALAALEEVLGGRRNNPDDLAELITAWKPFLSSREITVLVARGPDGRPLAIAAAVIDSSACLIQFAVASDHSARWALHDHLVRVLIARGVRYLFAEGGGPFGALGFPTELHHYQHLLGYELRHLSPRTD